MGVVSQAKVETWSPRANCCKFCPRRLCPRCRWGLCPDPKLARRWRFQNACIGGCAPPALGYDFGETSPTTPFRRFQEAPGSEVAPRRLLVTMSSRPYWQARFGSSKRCPYQRLCSASFWLCFSRDIYMLAQTIFSCVCVVLATLGTAPVLVCKVAARRPAAGSSSWIGQTHERGQRGRRQGHPRGGLSIEGKAENGPSGWTLRSLYALLALCGP